AGPHHDRSRILEGAIFAIEDLAAPRVGPGVEVGAFVAARLHDDHPLADGELDGRKDPRVDLDRPGVVAVDGLLLDEDHVALAEAVARPDDAANQPVGVWAPLAPPPGDSRPRRRRDADAAEVVVLHHHLAEDAGAVRTRRHIVLTRDHRDVGGGQVLVVEQPAALDVDPFHARAGAPAPRPGRARADPLGG